MSGHLSTREYLERIIRETGEAHASEDHAQRLWRIRGLASSALRHIDDAERLLHSIGEKS